LCPPFFLRGFSGFFSVVPAKAGTECRFLFRRHTRAAVVIPAAFVIPAHAGIQCLLPKFAVVIPRMRESSACAEVRPPSFPRMRESSVFRGFVLVR
jgi:hypothetical protein